MPCDYKKYKFCGIYYIKNVVTQKYYIGSSLNITKRLYQYDYLLRNNKCHSPKLQNSYNKYGESKFVCGVITECFEYELKEKEAYYIDLYNSVGNGYNCSNNTICSTRGRKMSQSEIEVLSNRNKERWANDDGTLKTISQANIKKATEKRRGSHNSTSHNIAISKSNTGRPMLERVKKAHSLRMKERPLNYWLGKKRNELDKLKMRMSHIGKVSFTKPIIQYDLTLNEINRFDGATDAARKLNISRTAIKNNLLGLSKTCNKQIFRYAPV